MTPQILECDICGDDVVDGEGYACPDGYECERCAQNDPIDFGGF